MRPLSQLWLDALGAPADFAFAHSELALVEHATIAALGAVTKPETFNYRTFAPERHGLFSVEAFGPGDAFPDMRESTEPYDHPRATTFGRIDLPVPMVHPLALVHTVDDVAERLHIPISELREISSGKGDRNRLRAALDHDDAQPIIIRAIPVLPPYLRPLVPLDRGRWATSDLNDLYRRVVNRGNRLARLRELNAPPVIIDNEEHMLYEALDELYQNEARTKPVTGPEKRALVSLKGLASGPALFAGLAEHERGAPLNRTRQTQLAALYALCFELRPASTTIAPRTVTLGVPL